MRSLPVERSQIGQAADRVTEHEGAQAHTHERHPTEVRSHRVCRTHPHRRLGGHVYDRSFGRVQVIMGCRGPPVLGGSGVCARVLSTAPASQKCPPSLAPRKWSPAPCTPPQRASKPVSRVKLSKVIRSSRNGDTPPQNQDLLDTVLLTGTGTLDAGHTRGRLGHPSIQFAPACGSRGATRGRRCPRVARRMENRPDRSERFWLLRLVGVPLGGPARQHRNVRVVVVSRSRLHDQRATAHGRPHSG